MDDREVRSMFYEQLFKREDGDKTAAALETRLAVSVHIVATLDLPDSDDRFWQAVSWALRLKVDLRRKEMWAGTKQFEKLPFTGGDEAIVYRVLDAERDVLTYIARHLGSLPASSFKERHTRQDIETQLAANKIEYERIVREYNSRQFTMIPRSRIEGLVESVDSLVEALLGTMAYNDFAIEFNKAQVVIHLEQYRPDTATKH